MNTVLDLAPHMLSDESKLQFDFNTITIESPYTTAPIVAIKPLYQQPNEEELHTSFEKAISGRQLAIQHRLSRLSSNPALHIQSTTRTTEPLRSNEIKYVPAAVSSGTMQERPLHFISFRQRVTILVCLMLMFLTLFVDFTSLLSFRMH